MRTGIKIIKRKAEGDANDLRTATGEKSVEQTTREMVSTVKSWIAEVQQRKRTERHSFSPLPFIPRIAETQNP